MAIPNINQITSTLRMMGDTQLQQYAAMHKDDPYILPMAVAESNARKQTRAQAQARSMGQPQQKVVDASIAQMDPRADMPPQGMPPQGMPPQGGPSPANNQLPEQQGIAQLPTPNIQNMAGGGIVAFADGGYTDEDMMSNGEPVVRMADGGVPRYNQQGLVRLPNESFADYRRRIFDAVLQEQRDKNSAEEKSRESERQRMLAERGADSIVPPSPFFERAPLALNATQTASASPAASVPSPTDPNFRRQPDPRITGTAATAPSAPTAPPAPAVPPASAAPNANPRLQAGLGSLDAAAMTKTALEDAAKQPNPFAKDIESIGKEKVKAKEAEVTGLEAIQKQFSDIYKGRKERLDSREGDIQKMKDQSLGLAFLQAGAAMMTTRGGLGSAIGAGVDTGTKQYALGLDKVRSAQEKLSDARDRLEDIENNRNEMSARELNKARNEVKNVGIGAREDMLKANMQMYGVNRETALKMVDNQIKVGIMQTEQAGANARTQMQVGAQRDTPDRLVFDQLVKANQGDAVKAAEALQKMKAEKFNMYEAYSKYLTGFAGKETLTPPLDFDQFASKFSIPTTKAPGKGATVLTQP
jgi:hypothetical protein